MGFEADLFFAQANMSTFADSRDGKVYKTLKIGGMVWMAQNLNYDAPGSVCYDNNPVNGDKYGRLYTWAIATKACPPGWHLPTDEEWTALIDAAGGTTSAGKRLIIASDISTDEFGFSAVLSGMYLSDKREFKSAGELGNWFSSSGRYYRMFNDRTYIRPGWSNPLQMFSVRCTLGEPPVSPA